MGDSIKAAEARLTEIAVLKTHIINYAKPREVYAAYRKARNEMRELVRAQKNVERFFAEEKDTTEKTQTR